MLLQQSGAYISSTMKVAHLTKTEVSLMETQWQLKFVLPSTLTPRLIIQEQAQVIYINGKTTLVSRPQRFMKAQSEASNGLVGSCFHQVARITV